MGQDMDRGCAPTTKTLGLLILKMVHSRVFFVLFRLHAEGLIGLNTEVMEAGAAPAFNSWGRSR